MSEFKNYHPIVNFTYFVFIIGFSCFFMHPIFLGISLFCGFIYSVMLRGRKSIKNNLIYMLPMIIFTALINPALNHEGVTVITYLPGGNPLTLESIIYGISAGAMLSSVICYFSCYNEVMSSDKFMYLFGKIIPTLSLVISMTLRFVPNFISHLKTMINASKGMGKDISNGNLLKRIKCALSIISAMTTWALENSIETADSMNSRGYGLSGRTAFSIFTFDNRDKKALFYILFLVLYVFLGSLLGATDFNYFPSVKPSDFSPYSVSVFISHFLLYIYPITIELLEVRKWKALRSKI